MRRTEGLRVGTQERLPPLMTGSDDAIPVRILTFNCWGLKYVSAKREKRIEAISERLRRSDKLYDIIALQEVWVDRDYELIKESVRHYLPYAKRWQSGILTGPGLVVFSRWPIESAWIFRFPLNGRPSAFWRGDWYVGKAAGSCVIIHPSGQKLEIINAHLHAPYAPSGDASYSCHRASQAWDLCGLVRRSILSGHVTFVTGDLNTRPQSVGMRLLEHRAHLSDAWINTAKIQKDYNPREMGQLSPEQQIELAGVTSDSQLNTWRQRYALERAKRLDYVFYDSSTAIALRSNVCFTEPEPDIGSLSDHFGFTATFELKPPGSSARPSSNNTEIGNVHAELLQIIDAYRATSAYQARWRIAHFWLSTGIVVGLLVSVWWGAARNRGYVGFIYILASVVLTVTGSVNGLIGYLFGHNEHRALNEFEDQVKLSQQSRAFQQL